MNEGVAITFAVIFVFVSGMALVLFKEMRTHRVWRDRVEANDLDAWAAADDLFHRLLLDCSENARLTSFVNTLFDQAHRARIVTLRLRDVPQRSTQEHRAILQAIQAGDAVRTQTLFRAHRERAARELLELLERTRLAQL